MMTTVGYARVSSLGQDLASSSRSSKAATRFSKRSDLVSIPGGRS